MGSRREDQIEPQICQIFSEERNDLSSYDYLLKVQKGKAKQWGIVQKQTGTATLSIGGTISANAHGRRLIEKPFIDQVESFVLINASGRIIQCSRKENKELFCLVVGGYGLFGIIAQVRAHDEISITT